MTELNIIRHVCVTACLQRQATESPTDHGPRRTTGHSGKGAERGRVKDGNKVEDRKEEGGVGTLTESSVGGGRGRGGKGDGGREGKRERTAKQEAGCGAETPAGGLRSDHVGATGGELGVGTAHHGCQ